MARKKKKASALSRKQQKAPTPRFNWSFKETIELIAWLDHTVKHKTINFDDTVVGHLKEASGIDFTLKQVWKKLAALWSNLGRDNYPRLKSWRDVFDHGSKILILTGEEAESIALAQKKIEEQATTTLLETPRRTRGDSKPGDGRFSPLFSLETILVNPIRQHSIPRVQDGSALSPAPTGRTKRLASYSEGELPRSKKQMKVSRSKRRVKPTDRTPKENNLPNEEMPRKSDIHASDQNILIRGSEEDSLDKEEKMVETDQVGALEEQQVQESEQGDNTMKITEALLLDAGSDSDISSHADSLDQANLDFKNGHSPASSFEVACQARLDSAIDKVKSLQQQVVQQRSMLHVYRKNKSELEEEIRIVQEAQTERDRNSGKGFEATIEEKNRYIRKTINELNDRRILGRFTKFSLNSQATCGETSIATAFNDIYVESRNIVYQCNRQRPSLISITSLGEETDLNFLLRKVLGADSLSTEEIKLLLSKLSSQEIVRLVTMSALREWVFEANFPQFAEPSSELFEQYRESIGKLDGALALRNLDLAAHNSIITSDNFRNHRIPKLAKELTKRLSRALAPLFVKDSLDYIPSDLDGFPTWNQEQDVYEQRRTRMRTIFERALTAKADSLLNLEEYNIVIYLPGTDFKEATMAAENIEGNEKYLDKLGGGIVEVCLEAAVFSYPKRKLGGDGAEFITEALVRSRNFSHVGNVQREGGRLLVKARVLLRDRQPISRSNVRDSMSDDEGSG